MHFSILKNEEDQSNLPSKFDQGLSLLDYASQEIRSIAHNLSPYILLQYDLEKAISHFFDIVKNSDLQIDCYVLGEFPKFDNSFKPIIYWLVQELINNIIKHACASHALVQLSYHENVLSITVEDNGVGFKNDRLQGIGWIILKNRVNDLHGQVHVSSEPGNGTTVFLEFDTALFVLNPVLEPVTVK
jgi:signal transduction histidine kinase